MELIFFFMDGVDANDGKIINWYANKQQVREKSSKSNGKETAPKQYTTHHRKRHRHLVPVGWTLEQALHRPLIQGDSQVQQPPPRHTSSAQGEQVHQQNKKRIGEHLEKFPHGTVLFVINRLPACQAPDDPEEPGQQIDTS